MTDTSHPPSSDADGSRGRADEEQLDSLKERAARQLEAYSTGKSAGIIAADGQLKLHALESFTALQHILRRVLPDEPYDVDNPKVLYQILSTIHPDESIFNRGEDGKPVKSGDGFPLEVYGWAVGVLLRIRAEYSPRLTERRNYLEKVIGEESRKSRNWRRESQPKGEDEYRLRYIDYIVERLGTESVRTELRQKIEEEGLLRDDTQTANDDSNRPPNGDEPQVPSESEQSPASGRWRPRPWQVALCVVCVLVLIVGGIWIVNAPSAAACQEAPLPDQLRSQDWGPQENRDLVSNDLIHLTDPGQSQPTGQGQGPPPPYPNWGDRKPPDSPIPGLDGRVPSINNAKLMPVGFPPGTYTGFDLRTSFLTANDALNSDITNGFDREIRVRPDGVYLLRAFLLNTAEMGIDAEHVSLSVRLPKCPSTDVRVVAQVSSSNTTPAMIWGSVRLKSDRPFTVEPSPDTVGRICTRDAFCSLYEFCPNLTPWGTGQIPHPEHAFEEHGITIGSSQTDGILKGNQYVDVLLYVRAKFT